jgi:hypothetical protein
MAYADTTTERDSAVGAPDTELIASLIKEHFDNRWGQYPAISEVEARLLAKTIAGSSSGRSVRREGL